MTEEQKANIVAKIEWEGFEYFLENYREVLVENNAPQRVIDAAENAANALKEAEDVFDEEGLLYE